MPQDLTPQLRTRLTQVERLVGLFVGIAMILALSLFGYFLWHTAEERGWLKKKARYFTFAEDGTGLKVGGPVVLTGFTIGKVTKVETLPMEQWAIDARAYVYIEFEVVDPYYGYILTDSKVVIGAGDFLGTRSVEVERGIAGTPTANVLPNGRLGVLSPKFASEKDRQKATNEFLRYTELGKGDKGYHLGSREQLPLPATLTLIATDIRATIPDITNRIFKALDGANEIVGHLNQTMPKMESAVDQLTGALAEFKPALSKPGGIGELLIPPNLNLALENTLSNVNANTRNVAPLMSNVNSAVTDIRGTLTEVRGTVASMKSQLEANTNLVGNVSQLAASAHRLADTTDTLLRRHWLFRSAFKTNSSAQKK
ncbi:MAG TPA: MlaD family protein [Candidatus Limnocylindria bacterium]|nr:MlaD family protein [Candidatus Limnocylindria bacterium]